jgi:protein tyrosine/serine phosphatase
VTVERILTWDGCFNVRDLGGLATADGRLIRHGAVVRADKLNGLSAAGWEALIAHGVRTVVDLRDPSEHQPDVAPRPSDLTTLSLPLEDQTDVAFWERWRPVSGTPLYYRAFLEHAQPRIAAVLAAIAEASAGAVVVHCAAGRDRTGLVTLVLLAALGVSPEVIVADYALSAEGLRRRSTHLGHADEDVAAQEHLRRANTTMADVLTSLLATLDVEAYLRAGGLTDAHLTTLRARLLTESTGAVENPA